MDVDAFLKPVSEAEPCGPDLQYDPAMVELEKLAQGTPEQELGSMKVAAQEPNWREVRSKATDLLLRSRNLNVLLWLTLADLKEEGIKGMRDGLAAMRGLLENRWDGVYPRLDPDDNNDPTQRMNVIACLSAPMDTFGDAYQFVRRLREAPLAVSRQLGRFSVRDIQLSRGELPAPEGVTPPDPAVIEGAFTEMGASEIQAIADVNAAAMEHLKAMTAFLAEKVGHSAMPAFGPLQTALTDISKALQGALARQGVGVAPEESAGGGDGGTPRSGHRLSGEISSHDDVRLALEKVIRYYEINEKSSPVPLVLKMAQQLVGKTFLDITQTLDTTAVEVMKKVSGEGQQS